MSWFLKSLLFLEANGFINLTLKKDKIKEFNTLGLLVKKNILYYLNDLNNKAYDFDVLPIDNVKSWRNLSHHFRPLKTYALYFTTNDDNHSFTPYKLLPIKTIKNLLLFTEPIKSRNAFYSIHNTRYRLWRRISLAPANFNLTNIEETENGDEKISIFYKSSDSEQQFSLETIRYIKDESNISQILGLSCQKHLIWCQINVENSTFAYLIDGCNKSFNKDEIETLHFHEYLAPYHVAFVIYLTSKLSVNLRLEEIVTYLIRELSANGLYVFPIITRIKNDESNFLKFDKMGIPYVLCFSEENIKTGVICVRSRNTKLKEQLHISRVKIYLLLYLRKWNPQDFVDLKNLHL